MSYLSVRASVRLGFQIRGHFRSGEARAELDPGTSAEIPKICGFGFS